GSMSFFAPQSPLRAISAQNTAIYGVTTSTTQVAAIQGVGDNMFNHSMIGVLGQYNAWGQGTGVAGIAAYGNMPPSGTDIGVYGSAGAGGKAIYANGTVQIVDGTQSAGKVLTSDANGNASWQNSTYVNNVVFKYNGIPAAFPPLNVGGSGQTVTFSSEQYDYGNNASSNSFTAPNAGVYHFTGRLSFTVNYQDNSGYYKFRMYLRKNGIYEEGNAVEGTQQPATGEYTLLISVDLLLNAGDVVNLGFDCAADQLNLPTRYFDYIEGSFSGFKVR
ncbi:MAG: hypothetical protein ACXVPE_11460, partial [Bacteroidia bacterium]